MRRVEPVIDAWFDSGSMPTAQWGYPLAEGSAEHFVFPADFICEAIDQTRGWFYSLLAVNTLVRGTTPYRNVLCLGHIVDAEGRKMSKSIGNVIDPWEILTSRGADPLRWWMFSQGSPWTPTRVSLDFIDAAMREELLTLWNTWSFFTTYASLNGFDPARPGDPARRRTRSLLDRWMRSRLHATVEQVTASLDDVRAVPGGDRHRRTRRRRLQLVRAPESPTVLAHRPGRGPRRLARRAGDAPRGAGARSPGCSHRFCPFLADRMWRDLTGADESDSVHLVDWPVADTGRARPRARGRDGARTPARLARAGGPVRGGDQGAPAARPRARPPASGQPDAAAGHGRGRAQRRRDRADRRARRRPRLRVGPQLPGARTAPRTRRSSSSASAMGTVDGGGRGGALVRRRSR